MNRNLVQKNMRSALGYTTVAVIAFAGAMLTIAAYVG